jgi:hypothetical protein
MATSRHSRRAKNIANNNIFQSDIFTNEDEELDYILDNNDNPNVDLSSDEEGDFLEDVSIDDDVLPAIALVDLWSDSSESSNNEDEDGDVGVVVQANEIRYTAKNGVQWSTEAYRNAAGRVQRANIIRETAGPKRGIHPQNERESFLMYTNEMIEETLRFTNLQGRRSVQAFNARQRRRQKVWTEISRPGMEAVIGLNIILGAYKAHYRNINELFSERDGHPICRATMSKERLKANREIKSCEYFYRPNMMIASYFDKRMSPVLLLSTEHNVGVTEDNGKPQIVNAYNATKSGVDNLDHMVRLYSSKRKCQRWPYEMAFNFFDVAAVNAYIIMHFNNDNKRSNERYIFLLNLGYALVAEHIEQRQTGTLTRAIRLAMSLSGFKIIHENVDNLAATLP